MIITDLSYLTIICDREKIIGGKRQRVYDNKALAIARSSAYGRRAYGVSGTSVYLDRGVSQAQSFSEAQSTSDLESLK